MKLPLKPLHKGMGLYQVLYWPVEAKKAGYPDKPWAVVNLETGDAAERYHATKEEALAQARALYAKLGDKAKVQSEGVTQAYFFSASPELLLDGTDDGIKWVEAIAPKTYVTPAYGDVVITPDKVDRFISNLNNNVRGQEVAIDYEHGLDPVKGRKAAGWIRGARKNADGKLELAVEFTEPAKNEIINKEWKYFSLEWDDQWEHPDGIMYEDVVIGGALTNRPVAKDLMPINFSEIFTENDEQFDFAEWSTAYKDSLPDSSFAYIAPGGKKDSSGKTEPRSLRFFPYKDANDKVDPEHVRKMDQLAPKANVPDNVKSSVQALAKRLLGAKAASEIDYIDAVWMSETAAWERSDPGLVDPIYDPSDDRQIDPGTKQFIPRTPGNPSDDPAIGGGWRRNTPEDTDVFKLTEEAARTYMTQGAEALSGYLEEETTADDRELAKGILATTTELLDNDTIKYSEYTKICSKIKQFFTHKDTTVDDPNEKKFSEAEAIGYLTASKRGLDRIHTNAGNALIDRIDGVLNQDYRKRSFSELQTLVNETRAMLRGDDTNPDDSQTTKLSEGGKTVGELTEKDLRELRNVLDVDDDGKILEAVQHKFGELASLRDAVAASDQEKHFAEQYPQFYEQHRNLMLRDRRNTAKEFAEGVKKVRQAEGMGLKTTNLGLSTKAEEVLTEAHMKFSEGLGTVEDFENTIKAIMTGGLVKFGEIGSGKEDDVPEVDTSTAGGVATGRKVFAEVVAKVQKDHADDPNFSYQDAIAEAARKHPDLAESYRVALPA